MITFDHYQSLVTTIHKNDTIQDEFIDSLPSSIQSAFYDNAYVEALNFSLQKTLCTLLPSVLADYLEWFRFERGFGTHKIVDNDKVYDITTVDDFLAYMKASFFTESGIFVEPPPSFDE